MVIVSFVRQGSGCLVMAVLACGDAFDSPLTLLTSQPPLLSTVLSEHGLTHNAVLVRVRRFRSPACRSVGAVRCASVSRTILPFSSRLPSACHCAIAARLAASQPGPHTVAIDHILSSLSTIIRHWAELGVEKLDKRST